MVMELVMVLTPTVRVKSLAVVIDFWIRQPESHSEHLEETFEYTCLVQVLSDVYLPPVSPSKTGYVTHPKMTYRRFTQLHLSN